MERSLAGWSLYVACPCGDSGTTGDLNGNKPRLKTTIIYSIPLLCLDSTGCLLCLKPGPFF